MCDECWLSFAGEYGVRLMCLSVTHVLTRVIQGLLNGKELMAFLPPFIMQCIVFSVTGKGYEY